MTARFHVVKKKTSARGRSRLDTHIDNPGIALSRRYHCDHRSDDYLLTPLPLLTPLCDLPAPDGLRFPEDLEPARFPDSRIPREFCCPVLRVTLRSDRLFSVFRLGSGRLSLTRTGSRVGLLTSVFLSPVSLSALFTVRPLLSLSPPDVRSVFRVRNSRPSSPLSAPLTRFSTWMGLCEDRSPSFTVTFDDVRDRL